jgi:ABC-type Fe3+-siderophore transport system permease subunit
LFKNFRIDELLKNVVGYLETRLELIKLEIRAELAKIITKLLLFTLIMLVFAMFMIIGSITIGMYLNHLLESQFLGMVIVSGIYFLLLLFLYLTRNSAFWKSMINAIIDDGSDDSTDYDGTGQA